MAVEPQTKERPILFSGAMVRALLDGTKTQTRRVVKCPERVGNHDFHLRDVMDGKPGAPLWPHALGGDGRYHALPCPYGAPGDRLWVRETWAPAVIAHTSAFVCYRADGEKPQAETCKEVVLADEELVTAHRFLARGEWIPSIHMCRWASRILLEIVSVRVERLNEISEGDAIAEGIREFRSGDQVAYGLNPDDRDSMHATARDAYRALWEIINGQGSWEANPWVWVVEFKLITDHGSLGTSTVGGAT